MEEQIDPAHFPQLNYQLNLRRDNRTLLRDWADRVGTCDGNNRQLLRDWKDGWDRVRRYTDVSEDEFLKALIPTAKNPLQTLIDQWVTERVADGQPCTWELLKEHISQQGLAADEQEYLRDRLDRIRQEEFDDLRRYTIKFKECVRQAYSQAERAIPLINERIIKLYIAGIRSHLVRERVYMERPATLEAAVEHCKNVGRALELADKRHVSFGSVEEEAMEIGAVKWNDYKTETTSDKKPRRSEYSPRRSDSPCRSKSPRRSEIPERKSESSQHADS